jgi:hypothetical protein
MKDYKEKILPYKPYNSIGHLASSRLGESDSHIDDKTNDTFVKQVPNNNCLVIVQEKLDGSNVSVLKKNGELIALSRNGHNCATSNQEQHRLFNWYVQREVYKFYSLLQEGERIVGEWIALAHGTIYKDVLIPFIAFDIFTADNTRLPFLEFMQRTARVFATPKVIHMGGACPIKKAQKFMATHSPDRDYEGFIYRLEENGKFKSIAKYVRHEKVDGKYLEGKYPEKDMGPVWNWYPDTWNTRFLGDDERQKIKTTLGVDILKGDIKDEAPWNKLATEGPE